MKATVSILFVAILCILCEQATASTGASCVSKPLQVQVPTRGLSLQSTDAKEGLTTVPINRGNGAGTLMAGVIFTLGITMSRSGNGRQVTQRTKSL